MDAPLKKTARPPQRDVGGTRYAVHRAPVQLCPRGDGSVFRKYRTDLRPVEETVLIRWCKARGITLWELHRRTGVCYKSLQWWARGQMLPTLVHAAHIERITQGGVPIASWLDTGLAREHYRALLRKVKR